MANHKNTPIFKNADGTINLQQEFKSMQDQIGEAQNVTYESFLERYENVMRTLTNHEGKFIKIVAYEDYKKFITDVLYVTLVYSWTICRDVEGISEHTGFTTDLSTAYSWWKLRQPGGKGVTINGKTWNHNLSLFEFGQALGAGTRFFLFRMAEVGFFADMPYDDCVKIREKLEAENNYTVPEVYIPGELAQAKARIMKHTEAEELLAEVQARKIA